MFLRGSLNFLQCEELCLTGDRTDYHPDGSPAIMHGPDGEVHVTLKGAPLFSIWLNVVDLAEHLFAEWRGNEPPTEQEIAFARAASVIPWGTA